jgi:hypothetical protein
MDRFRKSKLTTFLWLLLFVGVISGCSSLAQDKLWVKSEGWSRAVKLGQTGLAAPAPAAIDADGEVISLLFPALEGEEDLYQPEVVTLSSSGEIQSRTLVELGISKPADADIRLSDGLYTIFWLQRNQLHAIQTAQDGQIVSGDRILSGDSRIYQFSVINTPAGFAIACSGNPNYPGVYVLLGKLDDLQKIDIDPEGIRLNQYLDQEGRYHLGWVRYPSGYGNVEIYYLASELGAIDPDSNVLIQSSYITPGIRITGPVMGFDRELGYFFWSELIVSGMDAGAQTTFLQYFPLERPEKVRPPMGITAPAVQLLDEVTFFGGYFQSGPRALSSGSFPRTTYLDNISVLPGGYQEMAFAYRSTSEYKWRDARSQVNVGYIKDGLVTSFQPISYTSTESNLPLIFQDQQGDLYLTWLEKEGTTFYVYLTTTDPTKRETLDFVSAQDYLYLAADGLFGILAGVVLSPFAAAVWGGAGLLGFVFNLILSQFNRPIYRNIGEILSMVAGIYIFWWLKLATLPGIFGDYVPFSAWIPHIPQSLEQPLVIGVPILIGLISLAVAWSRTYGREAGSAINFHLIYSGMDALLSCAVYGILIYGSF